MKKLIIIFLLALTGCGSIQENQSWELTKGIMYASDKSVHGVSDYWQTSEETRKLKTGDCDDFAIMHYENLVARGENPNYVIARLINDKKTSHMWVESNGYSYSNHEVIKGELQGFDHHIRFRHGDGYYQFRIEKQRGTEKLSGL